jgi:hypothetical protein
MSKYNVYVEDVSVEAVFNKLGGVERAKRFLQSKVEIVYKSILTFLRPAKLGPQPAMILTEEYWKSVGVVWMGDNFQTHLLGLEVARAGEMELAVSNLEEASVDAPILAELGDRARIPASQIGNFLKEHKGSEEYFIFYPEELPDWAVSARWFSFDGGWSVLALPVTSLFRWLAGSQVVSRLPAQAGK